MSVGLGFAIAQLVSVNLHDKMFALNAHDFALELIAARVGLIQAMLETALPLIHDPAFGATFTLFTGDEQSAKAFFTSRRLRAKNGRMLKLCHFAVQFAVVDAAVVAFAAAIRLIISEKLIDRVFLRVAGGDGDWQSRVWQDGHGREEEEKHRLDYAAYLRQFMPMVQCISPF